VHVVPRRDLERRMVVGPDPKVCVPATVVGTRLREGFLVTRRLIARFLVPAAARRAAHRSDAGAATAEYAVVTVAAAGLGGILIKLLSSDWFLNILKMILEYIIRAALSFFGLG